MNCTRCPDGATNSGAGNAGCPVELAETDNTLVIVLAAVFGGLVLIVSPVVCWKVMADRAKMNAMYSEKAVAQNCASSIACMRLEEVDYIRHIERPSLIIQSLILIMDNLVEYRRYLPQTLLVERQSDSDVSESVTKNSSTSLSAPTGSIGAATLDASTVAGRARVTVGVSVMRRELTIVAVNIVSFLRLFRHDDPYVAVGLHASVAERLITIFNQTSGASETFNGDRFVATYNTVRSCVSHKMSGCKALTLLAPVAADLKVKFSSSCVSGTVRCGTVGCPQMKRYTFFGACVPWAFALERICKSMGVSNLIDNSIFQEAPRFELFSMDAVLFLKHGEQPKRVYTVKAERQMEAEEWMYQLESCESDSQEDVVWNKWAAAVMEKEWGQAEELWKSAKSIKVDAAEKLRSSFHARTWAPTEVQHH
eukprot:TRINITY_DN6117_c1_g1_i1.p1 TRINITY_DN6117_c1_g1~~TRINITY_DN6117_c1_g1_i1.p1  ORF type:complete len:431 (+),score=138.84 TRINITY_DN6117_c1_g1_i1:23-1294(+)